MNQATALTHRGDVSTPAEVDEVVRRFYRAVAQDDLLGPVFNDVAQVDWAEHLPKLSAFWCRILFGHRDFTGNALARHRENHDISPFTVEMFRRWLTLFDDTLDESWSGPHVDSMKALARNVARVHSTQLIGVAVLWPPPAEPEDRGGEAPCHAHLVDESGRLHG